MVHSDASPCPTNDLDGNGLCPHKVNKLSFLLVLLPLIVSRYSKIYRLNLAERKKKKEKKKELIFEIFKCVDFNTCGTI